MSARSLLPAVLAIVAVALAVTGCGNRGQQAPIGAAPLSVVGLGDSVMSGTHCDCPGIAQEYGVALGNRQHRSVEATNLGRGGLTTSGLLHELSADTRTRRAVRAASVVLVVIGANDLLPQMREWTSATCGPGCFRRPSERMGDRVRQVIAAVAALRSGAPRNTVLVANYWNVFTDGAVARRQGGQHQLDWSTVVTATANGAICRAAAAEGARCVDLVAPFKGDGGADPTDLLATDGDHPNAAGARKIVGALLARTPHGL
jgi:lysophospholipase L1-like esterase